MNYSLPLLIFTVLSALSGFVALSLGSLEIARIFALMFVVFFAASLIYPSLVGFGPHRAK